MSTVDFTLKRAKDGQYYGVGYKVLFQEEDKNGKEIPGKFLCGLKRGVWVKDKNKTSISTGIGLPDYAAGYHIWLTQAEAEAYNGRYGNDVYKVQFSDVVSFGTNSCSGLGPRPCIIARNIKVISKVKRISSTI